MAQIKLGDVIESTGEQLSLSLEERKELAEVILAPTVEEPKKKKASKPRAKKEKVVTTAEISIPQDFDYIEWAEKLKPLVKDPFINVQFVERPQELWGSDPTIPQTKEHFEEMLHHLSKYDNITCDVETSGLSFVDPLVRICGHVLTGGDKSFYIPIRHNTKEIQLNTDYVTDTLRAEVYGNKLKSLNFHNALFDYNQLLKDGIDLTPRFKDGSILDTQIMWWLLDENQKDDPYYYLLNPGRPATKTSYRSGFKGHAQKAKQLGAVKLEGFSLKVLAPKYVGTPMTKFDDLMTYVGFHNLPIHFGGAYAKVDGDATQALRDIGMPRIKAENLEQPLYKVEMPFVRVNANMQRRGMGINLPALERLEVRAIEEQKELEKELFEEIGDIKFSGKQLTALFHDRLGLPVLAKTDKGNPQFDEEAMNLYEQYLEEHGEKYGDMAKIPSKIIRIKKLEKIIGTYIKGIRENIDVDGRVHCSLFQTGTVTGRLSSGNPNLQNLPKPAVFSDELNKDEMIAIRKQIGDLGINKKHDFTVLFLDEHGNPVSMKEEGWESQVVKVVEKWLFRDIFSEKGFTPELKEKYQADYPRYGEVDAYVNPLGYGKGELVTIDICDCADKPNEYIYQVSDYAAMELRMIAHLANATSMIEAFENGLDPHKKTASDVFKIPFDEVTSEQRGRAKAVNFGLIYGKTKFGYAMDWYSKEEDFYVDSKWHPSGKEPAKKYLDMAGGFIDDYFDANPDVKNYIDSRHHSVLKNGYVRSITGRKRRLPEVFSENNSTKNRAMRQSVNAIDQGSSADYLKASMNKHEERSDYLALHKGIHTFQLLTIHDEIITMVQLHDRKTTEKILVDSMTKTVKLRCPIDTDPVDVYTYGSAK